MKHLGDITKISGYTVPAVDCIIGGSPCQDLSVAGKRAGLDGERSGLYMEQIRIVKELRDNDRQNGRSGVAVRPRYMVWENVPGAFSSNKAEDFRIVLEEIAKVCEENAVIPMPPGGKWTTCGCVVGDGWSVAWRVFDAQFWGVPQRRRRIALVADFGGQSAPEILFVRESVSGHLDEGGTQREGTSADAEGGIGADDREGGIAIVRSAGFKELNSAKARSDGFGEEIAPTLSANKHDASVVIGFDAYNQCMTGNKAKTLTSLRSDTDHIPVVVRPEVTIALEGNGSRPSHRGNGYIVSDKSYTLNTTEVHGVAYEQCIALDRASFNQGKNAQFDFEISDKGVSSPLVAKGPGAVAYLEVRDGVVGTLDAHYSNFLGCRGGMERTMVAVRRDEACYWDGSQVVGTLTANNAGGNQRMPDKENFNCVIDQRYIVRRLTPLECERLQGYPDGWTLLAPIDDMTDKEYEYWCNVNFEEAVRDSRARPNEDGVFEVWKCTEEENEEGDVVEIWENTHKPYKDRTKAQMVKWYNKLIDSDSARYKALGNSIALPPWKWVLKRLCACYERDATMASLFDGIGGFPYLWEQINGKGSCLWASEIEEFPMAVTRVRIG